MPAGRPSIYTPELGEEICRRIEATQRGLKYICEADDMPDVSTVYAWKHTHPEFSERYSRAREVQSEGMLDDAVSITDGANDRDSAAVARVRADTRVRVAQLMAPGRFGNRVNVGGTETAVKLETTSSDPLELAKKIAFLLRAGTSALSEE